MKLQGLIFSNRKFRCLNHEANMQAVSGMECASTLETYHEFFPHTVLERARSPHVRFSQSQRIMERNVERDGRDR